MTATSIPIRRTVSLDVTWDGTDEVRTLTWTVEATTDALAAADGRAHSRRWAERQGCRGFTILSWRVEPSAIEGGVTKTSERIAAIHPSDDCPTCGATPMEDQDPSTGWCSH